MEAFEEKMRRGGAAALEEACRFFMKEDAVHNALRRITRTLDELHVPYALCGGMALVVHGYDRTTEDVDILVTREGLKTIHQALEGRGYLPVFAGSKNLRDTESGVRIEFLVTGGYPGDGKPKPVAFPNPTEASVRLQEMSCLPLETLVELKLASGMTAPGRLKDLADVQELIRALHLAECFAGRLNPYVREKYLELWRAVEEEGNRPDGDTV